MGLVVFERQAWWLHLLAARTNRVRLEICADPLGSEGSESANDAELNILREKVKFLRVAKILAKCNFEHLNDEDNLVRSRSAEAHLMSPRIYTTHRLTVQRAAQPPMVTMP